LAKRLRANDEPQYEALCHLAMARCEQASGGAGGGAGGGGGVQAEAEALVAASRAFLKAERKV